MLKFFRKIRKQLFERGNIKGSLIYALGEVLLVMIGILLALQVNVWNQNRINQKNQQKALQDLSNEFSINEQRIAKRLIIRKEYKTVIDKYLETIAAGKATYDDWLELHEQSQGGGHINPSLGVLNSLISTGNLNFISNDSLKYLLADWKDQLGDLAENEDVYELHTTNYLEFYAKHFPHRYYKWPDWPRERLEENFKQVSKNMEYWNRLIYIKGMLDNLIIVNSRIHYQANNIIQMINEELEKMN